MNHWEQSPIRWRNAALVAALRFIRIRMMLGDSMANATLLAKCVAPSKPLKQVYHAINNECERLVG